MDLFVDQQGLKVRGEIVKNGAHDELHRDDPGLTFAKRFVGVKLN